MNPWLMLAAAVALETVGSSALKASDGFTRPLPSLLTALAFGATFYLLSKIVTRLPLGNVYAIWAGAGTALTALAGVLVFGEALGLVQVLSLGAIITGVVVLSRTGVGSH